MHVTVADWIAILGAVTTLELGIAHGTIVLTNAIADKWIPRVQAWSAIFAGMNGIVVGVLSRFVAVLAIGMLILLAPGGGTGTAHAQDRNVAPSKTVKFPIQLPPIGGPSSTANAGTTLDQFVTKVRALTIADFQYALALSQASNNTITTPCWKAWVDILQKQQPPNDASGKPMTEPDPHLITDVEIASEWIAQLQPNSELSTGCAPLAQAAQKDIGTMIGAVVSGGALGLLKLPFAL